MSRNFGLWVSRCFIVIKTFTGGEIDIVLKYYCNAEYLKSLQHNNLTSQTL